MPSNSKKDNQYYGKYLECCTVAVLNNEDVHYKENYTFTKDETIEFMKEANEIAKYLGKEHTAIYEGDKTSSASGDILLDNGQHIEIKRVSAGTGTYFNTSIYYLLTSFGIDFKEYMKKYGLIDALKENFDNAFRVSEKNNSPISQKDASIIRNDPKYHTIWEQKICPIDENLRTNLTNDLINYFQNNPEDIYKFISDMLTKNTECKKTRPDRIIVYNYQKHFLFEIDLNEFINNISNNIKATSKGFTVGNVRAQFGWQNGNGLNNPTIRIFLDKEKKN